MRVFSLTIAAAEARYFKKLYHLNDNKLFPARYNLKFERNNNNNNNNNNKQNEKNKQTTKQKTTATNFRVSGFILYT